jgi:hypothetical protein
MARTSSKFETTLCVDEKAGREGRDGRVKRVGGDRLFNQQEVRGTVPYERLLPPPHGPSFQSPV